MKLVLAIAAILLIAGFAQASTLTVCSSGCDYTSIQTAVYGAHPNDTIEVHSGTYNESVVLTKDNLAFDGIDTGGGKPIVNGDLYSNGFTAILISFFFRSASTGFPHTENMTTPNTTLYWIEKAFENPSKSDAIAALDKIIQTNPKDAYAWYMKGGVLLDSKRYEESIAALNESIKLDPYFCNPWDTIGDDFYNLKKYDNALEAFERAIELCPDSELYWSDKGDALNKLGRTEEANDAYDEAYYIFLESDMDYETAPESSNTTGPTISPKAAGASNLNNSMANVDKSYNRPKLSVDYKNLSKDYANNLTALLNQSDRLNDALNLSNEAIANLVSPYSNTMMISRGDIYMRMGNYKEAITSYNSAQTNFTCDKLDYSNKCQQEFEHNMDGIIDYKMAVAIQKLTDQMNATKRDLGNAPDAKQLLSGHDGGRKYTLTVLNDTSYGRGYVVIIRLPPLSEGSDVPIEIDMFGALFSDKRISKVYIQENRSITDKFGHKKEIPQFLTCMDNTTALQIGDFNNFRHYVGMDKNKLWDVTKHWSVNNPEDLARERADEAGFTEDQQSAAKAKFLEMQQANSPEYWKTYARMPDAVTVMAMKMYGYMAFDWYP